MSTLALTGDVMLGRHAADVIEERPPEWVWGDVLPRLRKADLLFVNLECVVAAEGTGRPVDKTFAFRAPPKAVDVLDAAGVDAVCMANNHVLDFGEEALLECLDRLDAAGIAHAGAGRDAKEAWRPAFLDVPSDGGNLRVGLLCLTDNEPGWAAGADAPGTAHAVIDPDASSYRELLDRVAAAREACDLLVVGAHWGPNMRREPPTSFRRFARGGLEAGADVWWGTSAHLFQGVERRGADGEKVILYDAGDFVDDYRVDANERNDLSFLFELDVSDRGVGQVRLLPTRITAATSRVDRCLDPKGEWAMRRMEELSEAFGTAFERTEEGLVLPAG